MKDHELTRAKPEEAAVRLFEALAPENQHLRDALRPVVLHWLETTDWFIKKAHDSGAIDAVYEGKELSDKFELFEASLGAGLAGAPCRYCGAQAEIGLSDFLEASAGMQRTQATCSACSQDRDDYIQRHLEAVSPDLAQEHQLGQLLEDVEAYMKRRVKERRSR